MKIDYWPKVGSINIKDIDLDHQYLVAVLHSDPYRLTYNYVFGETRYSWLNMITGSKLNVYNDMFEVIHSVEGIAETVECFNSIGEALAYLSRILSENEK